MCFFFLPLSFFRTDLIDENGLQPATYTDRPEDLRATLKLFSLSSCIDLREFSQIGYLLYAHIIKDLLPSFSRVRRERLVRKIISSHLVSVYMTHESTMSPEILSHIHPAAGPMVLILLSVIFIFLTSSRKSNLPFINARGTWEFGKGRARARYMKDAATLIKNGLNKVCTRAHSSNYAAFLLI